MHRHTLWGSVGLLFSLGALAQPLPKSVFGPGEQTDFEVTMLGLLAGRAQVTVGLEMEQFGKEVWPLVAVGKTAGVASAYKLHDKFVAYYDPREQRSLGADFVTREGEQRRNERFRYEPQAKKVSVVRQWNSDPAREVDYEIAPEAMDLAGIGFHLRNKSLNVGEVYELPVFTGRSQYVLKATVVGTESITTKLGTFEAVVVKFNGDFSGKLKTNAELTLYLSADERHVPLKLTAEFAVGSVVIEAVKYEPGRTVSGS